MRAVASSDEPVEAGELLEEPQLTAGTIRVRYDHTRMVRTIRV